MNSPGESGPDSHSILMSFCNQAEGSAAFGLLSVTDRELSVVNTGVLYDKSGVQQATGLASYGDAVYAVISVHRNAQIVQLAPDLTIVSAFPLQSVRRPHSLVATGVNEFHVVSTGTECIVRVRICPVGQEVESEEVVWKADQSESSGDRYHLNGLALADGRLVVSGFGLGWRETLERRKEGDSALYDGFLIDVTTGEKLAGGLQMPHSPLSLPDGIAFCESAAESVTLPGSGTVTGLTGYTRGLCVVNNRILVGISQARQNHPVTRTYTSAVVALDRSDLSIVATVDLNAYTSEIYDLLPLAWPIVDEKPAERLIL